MHQFKGIHTKNNTMIWISCQGRIAFWISNYVKPNSDICNEKLRNNLLTYALVKKKINSHRLRLNFSFNLDLLIFFLFAWIEIKTKVISIQIWHIHKLRNVAALCSSYSYGSPVHRNEKHQRLWSCTKFLIFGDFWRMSPCIKRFS